MATRTTESRRVDPAVLEERRARRRARVVARLLPIVEQLLDEEDSYLDLKVERILEEGDMARSTFYSYFDDKADLIIALGETAMREIIDVAQAIWDLPHDATREQVRDAVRRSLETYLPHTRLMRAVSEASTYDARVRERFEATYAEAQRAAARSIRAGQRAGSTRRDINPEDAAGWLTWMAERGMITLVQNAGKARRERLADTFASILWYSLYDGQGRPAQ
jgi:TetR/AcrR family transcriptional regulator, ethionamide resistance regulator